MLLTKLITTVALALSAAATYIPETSPTGNVTQGSNLTKRTNYGILPDIYWQEKGYIRQRFAIYGWSTCDDFKNQFNFNGGLAGLVPEDKRNLQCWDTTYPLSIWYSQWVDISMGKLYTEKQGLACALEGMLWNNGNKDEFCIHPSDGPQVCCGNNGIPVKRDTTLTLDATAPVIPSAQSDAVDLSELTKRSEYIVDYDFDTVVEEIQNITERSDPAADAASVVCAWGWMENGFVREKFFVDGITCDEITNFFLSEQPPALPNDQDRNLQCYAATGTEYNNPGYPVQVDISTNDTPDGKQSMTCEMKQLMKLYGVDLKFCNPITQTCCLY
ncbi:hypothetical protein LTR56_011773 [Elasticomyces elasticus]|nr:hypothetical protein LTR56_011773 [Elasticomyces elasticus]KAK3663307.1 hypothetical protein LTR22_005965 [Elasticomyces elasticus]KAK4929037.1 hypothetical protein LTR49_004234 [Elasticomyces elasticus]KAK5750361.1 hypothetical protein LTS12_019547 [Elasticomyces elasticus]